MSRQQQVKSICEAIIREFDPEQLIVFGSEARGTAGPDSDVDLLVVMPFNDSPITQTAKVYRAIDKRSLPVDLLVRTPEQIRERLRIGDIFIREILSHGKMVHERVHA